jgi:ribosome-associated protein
MTSETLAQWCAAAAADKLAEDILVLDLRGISTFTDFFLICSGQSEPQLKAIAGGIEETLQTGHSLKPNAVDGYPHSQWVVMDYGSVVAHLFHRAKRELYSLEDLWSDAPRLALQTPATGSPA